MELIIPTEIEPKYFDSRGHNYGQDSERVGSDSEAAKQNSIKRSDLLCASINPIATMESLWKLLSGKQIIDQRVSTHSAMKCDSNVKAVNFAPTTGSTMCHRITSCVEKYITILN